MKHCNSKRLIALAALLLMAVMLPMAAFAEGGDAAQPAVYATFWSLVPPIVAIALALITKEVYSSLFVGILIGGLLYAGGNPEGTVLHVFSDGIVSVLSDSDNVGILIFLVILGSIVAMMNKAGGSAAFGRWASSKIDDYFNCLTVGSVMRPVTDKQNVSRAKLAYLIDATAAPVCIIAPISSWAAAVAGFVEGEDGFSLFIRAIPYNYYALLTIVMMVGMVLMHEEYGPMALHEANARKGDLFTTGNHPYEAMDEEVAAAGDNGHVMDLVIPIFSLIICCVIGMIYTGGFFEGADFVTAFSQSNASVGLALGGFFGLVITVVLYMIRRVMKFRDLMACLPEGFKAMVPAILILTFAWSLKAMTDSLGAKEYVAALVKASAGTFVSLLPAIIFLVGCFLAFATGTSWGTFGILIPIVVDAFSATDPQLMIIAISACMAGAVCGDHCSPISDTTIMASAGAQCEHVNHVSTQLPYAITAAAVSCVSYIVAGYVRNVVISLIVAIALMLATLSVIKMTAAKSRKS